MKRLGSHTQVAALMVALLIGIGSCTTYRSSYFLLPQGSKVYFEHFRLIPRIFAFKESKLASERVVKGTYSVTIRVQDSTTRTEDYQWELTKPKADSLADKFLQEVADVFVVDSLVLQETPPESAPIVLLPDRTNYAPRREDFLTLKFDDITFPRQTIRLRAVLHVTRPGLPPSADSVVFPMWRIEKEDRGLLMMNNQTQGY